MYLSLYCLLTLPPASPREAGGIIQFLISDTRGKLLECRKNLVLLQV
ncbi:MAG: hypothetical protein ACJAUG_002370 [Halioglobus sp.]